MRMCAIGVSFVCPSVCPVCRLQTVYIDFYETTGFQRNLTESKYTIITECEFLHSKK